MKILITNDDGPYSPGLRILYEAVKDFGEVTVIIPETPKSASGLGITLHKPIRIRRLNIFGFDTWLINGTPSDVIYLSITKITGKIDLVLSGINIGDNTSIQVILSSGTVGAAALAALEGIPAIAFSAAVETEDDFKNPELEESMKKCIRRIVKNIIEYGFPEDIDLVNINFPSVPTEEIVPVPPAKHRFISTVEERKDPRGRKYYWIYGESRSPEPGTDVYTVLVEKKIAISPLNLSLGSIFPPSFMAFVRRIKNIEI